MARADGRYELVTAREGRETLPLASYLVLQPRGPIREVPFEDHPTAIVLRKDFELSSYTREENLFTKEMLLEPMPPPASRAILPTPSTVSSE